MNLEHKLEQILNRTMSLGKKGDIGLLEARTNVLQSIIEVLNQVEPFYILLVVVLGLVGNTTSFFLFVMTKLRYNISSEIDSDSIFFDYFKFIEK